MKYVRDGQRVAPYCGECGCRLNQNQIGNTVILMHFLHPRFPYIYKDARDHDCSHTYSEWSLSSHKVYDAEVYAPN